jgi:serine/threonine-protein kinase
MVLKKQLPAGSSTQMELPFTGFKTPWGVAVDKTGTLYITDNGTKQVVKLAAGSSSPTVLPFTGLNNPAGVTVSDTGTVYVVDGDNNNGRVLQLTAG